MLFSTVQSIDLPWSAWPDGFGWRDNRIAAQHLSRDLVRPSSGLKELIRLKCGSHNLQMSAYTWSRDGFHRTTRVPSFPKSCQFVFCYASNATKPVTKGGGGRGPNCPLKKCVGYTVCITVAFAHAIDLNFGSPQKTLHPSSWLRAGTRCPPKTYFVTAVLFK